MAGWQRETATAERSRALLVRHRQLGALWPSGHAAPERKLRPRWRLLHATLGLTLLTGLALHAWMVVAWC